MNSHENSKSNAAIIENEGGKIGDETLEDEKHKNAKTSHSLDKQTEQSIAETQCDPPSSHDVADSACNQSLVIDHSDIEKDLETRTFGEDCSKQNNLSGGDNKKMTHNQSRLESMVPKSENDHHHSDLDRDDRQAQDYSIKIKDQNPIALNNSNINPKQIETSDMDSVSENLESLKIAQKIEEHESIKQTPLLQIHPRGGKYFFFNLKLRFSSFSRLIISESVLSESSHTLFSISRFRHFFSSRYILSLIEFSSHQNTTLSPVNFVCNSSSFPIFNNFSSRTLFSSFSKYSFQEISYFSLFHKTIPTSVFLFVSTEEITVSSVQKIFSSSLFEFFRI